MKLSYFKEYIHILFSRKLVIYNGFTGDDFPLLKKRVYAFIVDLLIISLISKGIIYSLIKLISPYLNTVLSYDTYITFYNHMDTFNAWVISLTMISYHFISCLTGKGITPGKLIFNLQVLPTGQNDLLSIPSCLTRSISYAFLYWGGFIFFLLPFIIKGGIGIQDWLSNSKVIDSTITFKEEIDDNTQLLLLNRSSHL